MKINEYTVTISLKPHNNVNEHYRVFIMKIKYSYSESDTLNNNNDNFKSTSSFDKFMMYINLYYNKLFSSAVEIKIIEYIYQFDLLKYLNIIQKEILILKKHGYTIDEISNILNINCEQIKIQVDLAFNTISEIIKKIKVN